MVLSSAYGNYESDNPLSFTKPEVVVEDAALDLALLKVDLANQPPAQQLGPDGVPHLTVSRRILDEGEPVYAYGFPLPEHRVASQLAVMDDEGRFHPLGETYEQTWRPRTTSAVVAAQREEYGYHIHPGTPRAYALDKALNYGNSGGPIIATETGRVHAVLHEISARRDMAAAPT